MSLYDEQIKQRIRDDDEAFSNAFVGMASVILGDKIASAMENDRIKTKNAIEAVMKYYHVKAPELPDDIKDINDQLDYLLRPSGIMRRVVELKDDWYKNAAGAFIASLKDSGIAVAIVPDKFKGYYFWDGAKGSKVHINRKTVELLDVEAICFYKSFPLRSLNIKDLFAFCLFSLSVSDIRFLVLATLGTTLIGFLLPILNQVIYSYVINVGSVQLLFSVFTCLICVNISQAFVGSIKSIFNNRIQTRLQLMVDSAEMMRILTLPSKFFRQYSSGELVSLSKNVVSLCTESYNAILTTGLTSIFSLAYIVQMAKYGPGMAIPGFVVIICSAGFSVLSTFAQTRIRRLQLETGSKEAGVTYSLLSGVQKIKLAGAEKRAFAQWAKVYKESAKVEYDPPIYVKLSSPIANAITLLGVVVIYYFAITTNETLANYYAFDSAYGLVMGAFTSLAGMADTFSQIKPKMSVVKPILDEIPEVSENKKAVTRLSGNIQVDNISFQYEEDGPMIIDDLSLNIHSGDYIAIVGTTGCGKSTLMRVLLGFETPQKGAVYYDGQDLASLDLKSLRQNIGTVIQDGKLFLGDVYSNIVVSAPRKKMEDAWAAAEMAGIADDIRDMPMGMHTLIGEGTGGISGGQRQRLMIARAIVPNPKILMFDEATSALDNITQKIVSDSLDGLKCTRIVIAHRLSTIRHCNRILVLDKGKIIEDGTYEELIEKNGFFSELVSRQRIDIPNDPS